MQDNIYRSWKLLNVANRIKKFNFFPSFFSTLLLNGTILYQISFTWILLFGKSDVFFRTIYTFFTSNWIVFVEVSILFFVIYFIMHVYIDICNGGLIHLIDTYFREDTTHYTFWHAFSIGLKRFLPIFEYNAFFSLFQPMIILSGYLFFLRIFGLEYWLFITIFFFVYTFLMLGVNIVFSYTKLYIVLEKKTLFTALSSSVGMFLDHIEITLRLFFSLIFVYVRVIILGIAVLLLPLIVSLILTYITSKLYIILAFSFVGVVYIVFLVFVSYLNSVLEIFVQSLWYLVYKQNLQDDTSQGNKSPSISQK